MKGKMKKFVFCNDPIPAETQDYEKCRRWMIDYISQRKDIVSLFEYGSVKSPGLSDLDFIVVLSKKPKSDIAKFLHPQNFNTAVSTLMDGATLMIMSEEDFVDVTLWDDISLKCLYGKSLQVKELDGQKLFFTNICRITDWLPWHVCRLTRLLIGGEIPIRKTIGLLYSFKYSLENLKKYLDLSRSHWVKFIEKVVRLRTLWFEEFSNKKPEFLSLIQEAQMIACEALYDFGTAITESGWYGCKPAISEGWFAVPGETYLHFTQESRIMSFERFLEDSNRQKTIIHLHAWFFLHFHAYSRESGVISSSLLDHLSPKLTDQLTN